jgi:uncharacterized protein YbjT (DUF2867 family)
MSRQILVLGATGMLGQPVAHCLDHKGHRVRIRVRNPLFLPLYAEPR